MVFMHLQCISACGNLHYEQFADGTVKCIEDEIPFDLPEGWAWARLGNLSAAIQSSFMNYTS